MAENTENWTKLESDSRYPRKYELEELEQVVSNLQQLDFVDYKGTVADYAELAGVTGLENGDAYVNADDGLVYVWNGTSFPAEGDGMDVSMKPIGVVEDGNEFAVSGGEVYSSTVLPKDIGMDKVKAGDNIISEYTVNIVDDDTLWVKGYYNKINGQAVDSQNPDTAYRSKDLIPVKGGITYNYSFRLFGNAAVIFYDKNNLMIQQVSTTNSSNTVLTGEITLDDSVVFMGLTFAGSSNTVFTCNFSPTSNYNYVSPDIFLTNDISGLKILNNEIDNSLLNRDVKDIDLGTNIIEELSTSDVNDFSLWGVGMLLENGIVSIDGGWRYSKKYYKLKKGSYDYQLYFTGNAKCLIYNSDKEITQVLSGTGADLRIGKLNITEDSFIRISFRGPASPERLPLIHITNTSVLKTNIITEGNYKNYIQNQGADLRNVFHLKYSAKKKIPMVTFICDDGSIQDKNWYIPLLDEYNVKSTLAISKHWVEGRENGTLTDRLSRSEIIDFYKKGHDIANHTVNHLYLNNITAEEAENEVLFNKLYLEDLLGDEVPVFVSPFGVRNAALDKMISKYHTSNYISGYGVRNELPLNSFFINRVSFDTTVNDTLLWDSKLLPALESCVENNEWLVFAIHSAYSTYLEDGGSSTWLERRNELRLIIEYCQLNNIPIMTAKNGFEYWKNHVDIGLPTEDKFYQLAMDMTEVNVGVFEQ